jgi:hypothetical protein
LSFISLKIERNKHELVDKKRKEVTGGKKWGFNCGDYNIYKGDSAMDRNDFGPFKYFEY